MNIFKLDGTIYKITPRPAPGVCTNELWKHCGADTVQRWNPEQEAWLDSDLSATRIRSYGEPCSDPNPDREFTADEILGHRGSVEVFCPHVESHKSSYHKIRFVEEFVDRTFNDPRGFRPKGRIEGNRMLLCMLPQPVLD